MKCRFFMKSVYFKSCKGKFVIYYMAELFFQPGSILLFYRDSTGLRARPPARGGGWADVGGGGGGGVGGVGLAKCDCDYD